MNKIRAFLGYRMRALIYKEFRQILRDRRLAISLILPPTLQLLLFGFALNATVSNLRLGVVDDSRTPESRELIANMTESKSFLRGHSTYLDVNEMGKKIADGDLDAGLVVPYDYARDLQRGRPATVQVLLNAMNSNTATIGLGFAQGVIATYNQTLAGEGIHARFQEIAAPDVSRTGTVLIHPAYLYNPGLEPTWFIVTGVLGVLLILNGSLISSAAIVKEREAGTLEQLLMSPASTKHRLLWQNYFHFFCFALPDGHVRRRLDACCVRNTISWKYFSGGFGRGPVPVVRNQHWHVHRHVHEVGAAGAAHPVFRESSAHFLIRSVYARGSDAEMAAACRAIQSDSALRPDLARGDVEGKRDRDVMAEFPRAFGVHRRARFAEHLAIQKTT